MTTTPRYSAKPVYYPDGVTVGMYRVAARDNPNGTVRSFNTLAEAQACAERMNREFEVALARAKGSRLGGLSMKVYDARRSAGGLMP